MAAAAPTERQVLPHHVAERRDGSREELVVLQARIRLPYGIDVLAEDALEVGDEHSYLCIVRSELKIKARGLQGGSDALRFTSLPLRRT